MTHRGTFGRQRHCVGKGKEIKKNTDRKAFDGPSPVFAGRRRLAKIKRIAVLRTRCQGVS